MVIHKESSATFTLEVKEAVHTTKIEVSAPTEVTEGTSFDVWVYVTCTTAFCDLRALGKIVQIFNAAVGGTKIAEKALDAHDPITRRSYTKFTLTAPAPGSYTWRAVFPQQSPHLSSSFSFSVGEEQRILAEAISRFSPEKTYVCEVCGERIAYSPHVSEFTCPYCRAEYEVIRT